MTINYEVRHHDPLYILDTVISRKANNKPEKNNNNTFGANFVFIHEILWSTILHEIGQNQIFEGRVNSEKVDNNDGVRF